MKKWKIWNQDEEGKLSYTYDKPLCHAKEWKTLKGI